MTTEKLAEYLWNSGIMRSFITNQIEKPSIKWSEMKKLRPARDARHDVVFQTYNKAKEIEAAARRDGKEGKP